MSLPDLDERFDELVLELRATQVAAPPELRERVRGLTAEQPAEQFAAPPARRGRRLSLRRLALIAVPAAVALAAGGALVAGLATSGGGKPVVSETLRAALPAAKAPALGEQHGGVAPPPQAHAAPPATIAPAPGRAQLYTADLYLRVANLSRATKSALAVTRSLGGYVRSVHYADGRSPGSADLVVRVPVRAVQTAIVRYSALGEILSQRVDTQDVQPQIDERFRRLQALRREITKLQALPSGDAVAHKLAVLRGQLRALQAEQAQEVRRVSFATVALELTTAKASKPKPQPVPPTRFHRTLDRAGAILMDEAIVVLYVLIVGGPIALLAAVLLGGGRLLRRRGEARLLQRS